MNKKRNNRIKKSISTAEVAFLLLAALVVIAAGVNYAILRNKQVANEREIHQVYQSIKVLDIETQSEMFEVNRKINRFAIKSELRELNSIMRERPDFVVERVNPLVPPVVHVEEIQQEYPNLFRNPPVATLSLSR